jgi:DNA-binding MurR/RpiR family transcriptional regulator
MTDLPEPDAEPTEEPDAEPDGEPAAKPRRPPVASPQVRRLLELAEGVRLTPTQRRIVHSLVVHAEQAAYLSTHELASLAHVSQPSVIRFANALGFDGYPELRNALRQAGAHFVDSGAGDRAALNEWQRSLSFEIAALERMREDLADEGPVRDAAALLAASRPLSVIGLRSAGPTAQYFGYFASKVLPDVRAVSAVGTVGMADALEHSREAGGTAVLVFLLPRYPAETLRLMRIAGELGFKIVCITDSPLSPASRIADHTLYAPVRTSLVFDSHAAPMTLSMVLLEAICNVDEARTQARLEAFDRFATTNELFVD